MKKLLIAVVYIAMIGGCKKEDPSDLTDVSERGEYFNCLINGKYWTFKQCTTCLFGAPDAVRRYELYEIPGITTRDVIEASNVEGYPQTGIEINIDHNDFLAGDTILLSKNPSRLNSSQGLSFANISNPYGLTDSVHTGRLIFTKRTNKWEEGVFDFTAVNSQGEIISVTKGRFAIALD